MTKQRIAKDNHLPTVELRGRKTTRDESTAVDLKFRDKSDIQEMYVCVLYSAVLVESEMQMCGECEIDREV